MGKEPAIEQVKRGSHRTGRKPAVSPAPPIWTLGDWCNFEFLLDEDREAQLNGQREQLKARDREIFSRIEREEPAAVHTGRAALFHAWLERRLALRFQGRLAPGSVLAGGLGAARWLLLMLGVLLAYGAVQGVIQLSLGSAESDRASHLNALHFLLLFPGIALFFTVISLGTLGRLQIGGHILGLPQARLSRAVNGLIGWLWGLVPHGWSSAGKQRRKAEIQRIITRIDARLRANDRLLRAVFIERLQWWSTGWAAGFTLSLFGAGLIRNLVIGWETTLVGLNPGRLYSFLQSVSTPWRWVLGQGTSPSLEQVRATQFFANEPGAFMPPPAAADAWFVFLCLVCMLYSTLPRLGLLVWSACLAKARRWQIDFEQDRFDDLYFRLTRPQAGWYAGSAEGLRSNPGPDHQRDEEDTRASKPKEGVMPPAESEAHVRDKAGSAREANSALACKDFDNRDGGAPPTVEPPSAVQEKPLGSAIQASNADHSQQDSETQESPPEPAGDSGVVLLIPDDIAAELRPQELRAAIAAQLGRYPGHTEQFPSRLAARRELIQRVAREEGLRQIILAQESFMPPTRSLLNFFAELRAHLAGDVLLRVCLIGKPESDAPGAVRQSVPTAELRVWSEKLQTLGDPYLDVLNAEAVNAE